MRGSGLAGLLLAVWFCAGTTAFAAVDTTEVLYQTANMGPPAANGGNLVAGSQYIGTRFQITEASTATAIGGHFGTFSTSEVTAFAAIIRLTSMTDFPDSLIPLNTPDVLATAVMTMPNPSKDITVPIGPVTLSPGFYAVMFGSGQFGTSGNGFATQNNPSSGPRSDFYYTSGNGLKYTNGDFFQNRYVLYGFIPEPGAAMSLIALASLLSVRRRRTAAPIRRGAGD